MRITYYRFPAETPEETLLEHGCGIILKDGNEVLADNIPDDKRELVDHIDRCIHVTVSTAKELISKYGGGAWTEHIDRSGGVFEVSEIRLGGNNSKFKYNHHL